MNNKGFMMAEVVVVSSIIIVTLVGLYTSYNKILAAYNQRVDYYDVTTLYQLANIREMYRDELDGIGSTGAVINENGSQVYYLDVNEITDMYSQTINPTFKDYIEYISDSVTFDTDNILIMERCINGDKDNCKYAYLEVFNNEETSE